MGEALSAGAVAGEQPIRRLVGDLLTAAVEEEGEEEGEEEEEAEDGMEESADEDEDDTAERMDDCGEAPLTPPEGFVYAPCPLLTTEAEQRALIGRKILAAHILDGATGWYQGMIQCFGVGASWKVPDATHIVLYKKKETGVKTASTAASRASSRPTTMDAASGGCCLSRSRAEGATRR